MDGTEHTQTAARVNLSGEMTIYNVAQIKLTLAEAMRVGAVRTSGPREWFDQVLIRASRGAERRQAARIGTKSEPVL